jgi:hypothetical protein
MAAVIQSSQPSKRRHSANHLSIRVPDWKRAHSTADPINLPASPASPISPSALKPYLRKLSLRDYSTGGVDLSRPLAENSSIAGLAFYEDTQSPASSAFPTSARHHRSTSNGSNFSVPTAPFAHPFRHTPRPYTPPIARTNTAHSSGNSDDEDERIEEDFRRRRFDNRANSASQPQPYSSYSSSSLARLANPSQTSLPTSRSRGDTMRSIDTLPASTRTSLDRAMTFFSRSKDSKDTPLSSTPDLDPAAQRAAAVHAARVAFAERQQAKELKASARAEKHADREKRKSIQIKPTGSRSSIGMTREEKLAFVGKSYDDYAPAHQRSLPAHGTTAASGAQVTSGGQRNANRGGKFRKTWVRFMAWLRTRLIRMQGKGEAKA